MKVVAKPVFTEPPSWSVRGTCDRCGTNVEMEAKDFAFIEKGMTFAGGSRKAATDLLLWMCPTCGRVHPAAFSPETTQMLSRIRAKQVKP